MNQNLLLILFGAVVSLVSSLLILLVTSVVQTWREERNQARQARIALRRKRIDTIENLVNISGRAADKLIDFENQIVEIYSRFQAFSPKESKLFQLISSTRNRSITSTRRFLKKNKINGDSFLEELERIQNMNKRSGDYLEQIRSELDRVRADMHYLSIMHDHSLAEKFEDCVSCIFEELYKSVELSKGIRNGSHIDIEKEKTRIKSFRLSIYDYQGDLLNKIDNAILGEEHGASS
jgi:hypothetical protein